MSAEPTGTFTAQNLREVARYERNHHGADALAKLIEYAADEIERLGAKAKLCDRMADALEAFGDVGGEGDEDFPDETPVVTKFGRTTNYSLKLRDFRRARTILAELAKVKP